MTPFAENCTSKCLPKRDELLLRIVFALPSASITGLVCISRIATSSETRFPLVCDTSPMYVRQIFIASVLPAPDSPEMRIDCDMLLRIISLYAWSTSA